MLTGTACTAHPAAAGRAARRNVCDGAACAAGASAVGAFLTIAAAEPVGPAGMAAQIRPAGFRRAGLRRMRHGRMRRGRNRLRCMVMFVNQIQQPAEAFIEAFRVQGVHEKFIELRNKCFDIFQFIQRIRVFSRRLPE